MAIKHRDITIIIPAHNEEHMIKRILAELTTPLSTINCELIVVCNGCTDNTAEIVKSFYKTVHCIETSRPSKSHALNLGNEVASFFPRFYVDADILITLDDILGLALAMEERKALAAAPSVKMNLSASPWPVRYYYDIWCELPYCRAGMIGAGVYALTKRGRDRFSDFPDIIADDRFIRALFTEEERIVVEKAVSIVNAPRSLNGLIKIKTRSRLGGYQFEAMFPELISNEVKDYKLAVKEYANKALVWHKVAVYLAINLFTRLRAHRQKQEKGYTHWERDDTSRTL